MLRVGTKFLDGTWLSAQRGLGTPRSCRSRICVNKLIRPFPVYEELAPLEDSTSTLRDISSIPVNQ